LVIILKKKIIERKFSYQLSPLCIKKFIEEIEKKKENGYEKTKNLKKKNAQ